MDIKQSEITVEYENIIQSYMKDEEIELDDIQLLENFLQVTKTNKQKYLQAKNELQSYVATTKQTIKKHKKKIRQYYRLQHAYKKIQTDKYELEKNNLDLQEEISNCQSTIQEQNERLAKYRTKSIIFWVGLILAIIIGFYYFRTTTPEEAVVLSTPLEKFLYILSGTWVKVLSVGMIVVISFIIGIGRNRIDDVIIHLLCIVLATSLVLLVSSFIWSILQYFS